MKTIVRVRQDDRELFVLDRNGRGQFEMGDPAYASGEKKGPRRFGVDTIQEVIDLVQKGYSVRLRGCNTKEFNMISPREVMIVEIPE